MKGQRTVVCLELVEYRTLEHRYAENGKFLVLPFDYFNSLPEYLICLFTGYTLDFGSD